MGYRQAEVAIWDEIATDNPPSQLDIPSSFHSTELSSSLEFDDFNAHAPDILENCEEVWTTLAEGLTASQSHVFDDQRDDSYRAIVDSIYGDQGRSTVEGSSITVEFNHGLQNSTGLPNDCHRPAPGLIDVPQGRIEHCQDIEDEFRDGSSTQVSRKRKGLPISGESQQEDGIGVEIPKKVVKLSDTKDGESLTFLHGKPKHSLQVRRRGRRLDPLASGHFEVCDASSVKAFFYGRFEVLLVKIAKPIGAMIIEAICPSKMKDFPYYNVKKPLEYRGTPLWWPQGIAYMSPHRMCKPDLFNFLSYVVGLPVTNKTAYKKLCLENPAAVKWGDLLNETLYKLKKHLDPKRSPCAGEEEGAGEKRNDARMSVLSDLFHIAELTSRYIHGEIDGNYYCHFPAVPEACFHKSKKGNLLIDNTKKGRRTSKPKIAPIEPSHSPGESLDENEVDPEDDDAEGGIKDQDDSDESESDEDAISDNEEGTGEDGARDQDKGEDSGDKVDRQQNQPASIEPTNGSSPDMTLQCSNDQRHHVIALTSAPSLSSTSSKQTSLYDLGMPSTTQGSIGDFIPTSFTDRITQQSLSGKGSHLQTQTTAEMLRSSWDEFQLAQSYGYLLQRHHPHFSASNGSTPRYIGNQATSPTLVQPSHCSDQYLQFDPASIISPAFVNFPGCSVSGGGEGWCESEDWCLPENTTAEGEQFWFLQTCSRPEFCGT